MPQISLTKRSQIYTLRQEEYTVREIAAPEQVSPDSVLRIYEKRALKVNRNLATHALFHIVMNEMLSD